MYLTLGLKELPFEQAEKQAIYIESEYNENMNHYIQENYDTICGVFEMFGWEFVYIPKIADTLKKSEFLKYNAPYVKNINNDVHWGNDLLLQYIIYPSDRMNILPSLLYYNPNKYVEGIDAPIQYSAMTLPENIMGVVDLSKIVFSILNDCRVRDEEYEDDEDEDIRAREADEDVRFRLADNDIEDDVIDLFPDMAYASEDVVSFANDISFDEEARKLMKEAKAIVEKLKAKGVSEYLLHKLVQGEEKLSRLHITKDYRILLEDYDIEIEMMPLPKILFLLYLNHPEGINFKDLSDYREELMKYYKGVRGGLFSLYDAGYRIERLTTPGDNSVNEKCSSIKAAFISKITPQLANNYCIVGHRAETRKIILPRELVIWDEYNA